MKKTLLIISVILLSLLSAATTTSQPKRLITVQANDYIESLPDTAYVYFNFSIDKETPEKALALGEKVKANVLAVLEQENIPKKDILLDSTSVQEKYNYKEKRQLHSYLYSCKIKLTNFQKIAQLRHALINEKTFQPVKNSWLNKHGVDVDFRVVYELVENKGKLEKNALQKAYKKALGKINALAKVNSLKYRIFSITENGTNIQPYRALYKTANFAAEATVPGQVSNNTVPTMQRIEARLTVQAEII